MLKSENLALTPLRSGDLPALFEWINDRELVTLNGPYKPVSEAEHAAWFAAIQQRPDVVIFAIRLLKGDKLIGSCQLLNISQAHGAAELQIRLGDGAERSKGYGTEAVRLLLEFAFKDLRLRRVYLHVLKTNLAAIRVYEKVGFVTEGVLRKAAYIDGEAKDLLVMAVLEEEYGRQ
jgi:RimJ/RimL family protein N-acetyltransferase